MTEVKFKIPNVFRIFSNICQLEIYWQKRIYVIHSFTYSCKVFFKIFCLLSNWLYKRILAPQKYISWNILAGELFTYYSSQLTCPKWKHEENGNGTNGSAFHSKSQFENHSPQHFWQLSMSKTQGPQTKIGCSVWDTTQRVFDGVDSLVDENLLKNKNLTFY